jgi:hypothetical protein
LTIIAVITFLISYTNVLRKKKVELYFNGMPFTAHRFVGSYREGNRYILIEGSVRNVRGTYIFDLLSEEILPIQGNEFLIRSENWQMAEYSTRFFSYTILHGGGSEEYEYTFPPVPRMAQLREAYPDEPIYIKFSDSLGLHEDFVVGLSELNGFKDAEYIDFSTSLTGRYRWIDINRHEDNAYSYN